MSWRVTVTLALVLHYLNYRQFFINRRQSQTTSNRGTESHGSRWDSRVAEAGSKRPDSCGFLRRGNPVFHYKEILFERNY
jgi:hypothetical protein